LKNWPNSPVHIPKYDGLLSYPNVPQLAAAAAVSPNTLNNVSSTNSPTFKLMENSMVSPQHTANNDLEDYVSILFNPKNPS